MKLIFPPGRRPETGQNLVVMYYFDPPGWTSKDETDKNKKLREAIQGI
jgi:hypothetical protein